MKNKEQCPFCKSKRVERNTHIPICIEEGRYKYIYNCFDCKGEFGSDKK